MRGCVIAALMALPLAAMADQPPPDRAPVEQPQSPPPARPAPETPAGDAGTDPPAADQPPICQQLRESDFDYSACLLELRLLGAEFSEAPPQTDPAQRDCGIARPIRLQQPLPGIDIDGGALMRCDTARHLAHWLRDFVRPAAAILPGQPRLIALEPGSTYQCRATVGGDRENLSEHAFGNALDIAAFRFDSGLRIAIQPRQNSGDLTEAFQRTVRGAACLHFTTVLGPDTNAAHGDHLHLDIKTRKNGWRLCQ